ncbi:cellulase family glycosylhydrolase, partial [Candidatus Sumerlaeota bacterium]|nr:cellulase family glycosylhydrolase [Candidatus Sumerlaeota bacterium]
FGCQGVWANDPRLEEILDLMQAAGIRVARFDLCWWNLCEREPGVYNFTAPDHPGYESWNTDRLIDMLRERDIESYAILCYGNAMYDDEVGPHSPEGRAAFAAYCRVAAERYRDTVTIWEIWNEPNLEVHWGRESDPEDYALLAIEAADAIREANPDAIIVGLALSWLNIAEGMLERWYEYLEVCGEQGLFDHVDAVSVHPYRVGIMPESFNPELARIREIIARHTDRDVAVWTGEWGYNTIWTEVDEVEQAKYLPRMFLNNMSQGVEMSTWFSFHPFEGWGLMEEGTLEPRPAYQAMRVINEVLRAPVQHVEDPFGIEVIPAPEDLRIEVFESGDTSPALSRHVAAIWLERTADSAFEGSPVTLRLSSPEWVASQNTDIVIIDGLSGEQMIPTRVRGEEALSLEGRDGGEIRVSDSPIYTVITRHNR